MTDKPQPTLAERVEEVKKIVEKGIMAAQRAMPANLEFDVPMSRRELEIINKVVNDLLTENAELRKKVEEFAEWMMKYHQIKMDKYDGSPWCTYNYEHYREAYFERGITPEDAAHDTFRPE